MANNSLIQSARRMYESKYRPESKQWIADTVQAVGGVAASIASSVKSTREENMSDLAKKQESTMTSIENNDIASENFSNTFVELKSRFSDFNKISSNPFKSKEERKQASLEMQKIMKSMDNFQADAQHIDAYKTSTLQNPDVSEFATLGELADDAAVLGQKAVEDYQYMLPGNDKNLPTGIYVEQLKTGKLVRLSELEPPIKVARKTISNETIIDQKFVKDASKLTFDQVNRVSLEEINRFQSNTAEKASMYFDKRAGFGEGNDSFIEYHVKNTHAKDEEWNSMSEEDYNVKMQQYKNQIKTAFKIDDTILDTPYKLYKQNYNRNIYNAALANKEKEQSKTKTFQQMYPNQYNAQMSIVKGLNENTGFFVGGKYVVADGKGSFSVGELQTGKAMPDAKKYTRDEIINIANLDPSVSRFLQKASGDKKETNSEAERLINKYSNTPTTNTGVTLEDIRKANPDLFKN